jgi:hypothetical protein
VRSLAARPARVHLGRQPTATHSGALPTTHSAPSAVLRLTVLRSNGERHGCGITLGDLWACFGDPPCARASWPPASPTMTARCAQFCVCFSLLPSFFSFSLGAHTVSETARRDCTAARSGRVPRRSRVLSDRRPWPTQTSAPYELVRHHPICHLAFAFDVRHIG